MRIDGQIDLAQGPISAAIWIVIVIQLAAGVLYQPCWPGIAFIASGCNLGLVGGRH
jgi:hypothetical protein